MEVTVRNSEGKKVRKLTVDDAVFGVRPNLPVLHQAFVAQRANQRRGTASTKSRGQVQGSTRKVRSQKYTGRSRQGSARAPHRRGGGVVFGPKPRDYSQRLTKRMKRLAIRCALSGKLADGQLVVVQELKLEPPKTREMRRILTNLGVERSALIVTGETDPQVKLSARNLTKTKVLPAAYLNVVDVLGHRDLVMTAAAVARAEALWGGERARLRRGKPAAVAKPAAAKPKARRARAGAAAAPTAEPKPQRAKPAAAKPKARQPR
ncbi:MAG: 50S ribosomal protein L4, partial [Dehalococcoidia bacterium]